MPSIVIAQGGGPTAVINQTLCGAILAARRHDPSVRILGARYGVRGLTAGNVVDLTTYAFRGVLLGFENNSNNPSNALSETSFELANSRSSWMAVTYRLMSAYSHLADSSQTSRQAISSRALSAVMISRYP